MSYIIAIAVGVAGFCFAAITSWRFEQHKQRTFRDLESLRGRIHAGSENHWDRITSLGKSVHSFELNYISRGELNSILTRYATRFQVTMNPTRVKSSSPGVFWADPKEEVPVTDVVQMILNEMNLHLEKQNSMVLAANGEDETMSAVDSYKCEANNK